MLRPVLVALALASAPAAQVPIDPAPVTYLPGGAAAEGCRDQWTTRAAVRAYSAPTPFSRAIRTVDANRRVDANDYSEALTAVLEPGRVRARRAFEVIGSRLDGGRSERVTVAPGDEVTVLAYGPEESVVFAVGPAVYGGFVPGAYGTTPEAELVASPVTEVWVRLVEHDADRPAAWLNTAQAGMAPNGTDCD